MRIAIPWPLMLADWLWYERRVQQIIQELQHYPRALSFSKTLPYPSVQLPRDRTYLLILDQ